MEGDSTEKRPGQVRVDLQREVNTYGHLWHASWSVLQSVGKDQKGAAWLWMSSALLSAFTFEAYCNHVGPLVLQSWDDAERLSPVAKFEVLCEVLGADQLPHGEEPMQTVLQLFRFRNEVAHGRSVILVPEPTRHPVGTPPDRLDPLEPRTAWEALLRNDEFATRVRRNVQAALVHLHAARPDEDREGLFDMGSVERSYHLVGGPFAEPPGFPKPPKYRRPKAV
jgi:hypothetical protein